MGSTLQAPASRIPVLLRQGSWVLMHAWGWALAFTASTGWPEICKWRKRKWPCGLIGCRAEILEKVTGQPSLAWVLAQKPGRRTKAEASSALRAQPWLYLTALWSKWGSWNECQDVYPKSLLSNFLRKATLVLELQAQGFAFTNGLGNLGLKRPLTQPEGKHNMVSP